MTELMYGINGIAFLERVTTSPSIRRGSNARSPGPPDEQGI